MLCGMQQWEVMLSPVQEFGSSQGQEEPWAGSRTSSLGCSSLALGTDSLSHHSLVQSADSLCAKGEP